MSDANYTGYLSTVPKTCLKITFKHVLKRKETDFYEHIRNQRPKKVL